MNVELSLVVTRKMSLQVAGLRNRDLLTFLDTRAAQSWAGLGDLALSKMFKEHADCAVPYYKGDKIRWLPKVWNHNGFPGRKVCCLPKVRKHNNVSGRKNWNAALQKSFVHPICQVQIGIFNLPRCQNPALNVPGHIPNTSHNRYGGRKSV